MNNKRILLGIFLVVLFVVVVIVWYFFYAKPAVSPSLTSTKDPFATQEVPKRFFFTNWFNEDTGTSTTEVTNPAKDPLVLVWDKPSTGQVFIPQDILKEVTATSTVGTSTVVTRSTVRATTTLLMFVDRGTGYVYGYVPDTGKTYQISNTVVPGIHDAYIFNNGHSILYRYVDGDKPSIVSLLATIPNVIQTSQAEPLSNTAYLPVQVTSVALSKDNKTISYLVPNDKGSTVYTLKDKGPEVVASSPFKEWTLAYGADSLYATSKPSAYVEGSLVKIPSFEFVVGDKTGLITNPSKESILFLNSMMSNKGLVTFLSDTRRQVVVRATTLASKCGWGSKSFLVCGVPETIPEKIEGLPDDWFQGRYMFSDSLKVINSVTGDASSLYSFEKTNLSFDVTSIIPSFDNTLISFIRKQNRSLWVLNTNLLSQ